MIVLLARCGIVAVLFLVLSVGICMLPAIALGLVCARLCSTLVDRIEDLEA